MGAYEDQAQDVLQCLQHCAQNELRSQVISNTEITTVLEGQDLLSTLCDTRVDTLIDLEFLWKHRDSVFPQEMLDQLNDLLVEVRTGVKSESSYQDFLNYLRGALEAPLISRGKTL